MRKPDAPPNGDSTALEGIVPAHDVEISHTAFVAID
jgi:hypothetical protein